MARYIVAVIEIPDVTPFDPAPDADPKFITDPRVLMANSLEQSIPWTNRVLVYSCASHLVAEVRGGEFPYRPDGDPVWTCLPDEDNEGRPLWAIVDDKTDLYVIAGPEGYTVITREDARQPDAGYDALDQSPLPDEKISGPYETLLDAQEAYLLAAKDCA
jgi:hypothetical protein